MRVTQSPMSGCVIIGFGKGSITISQDEALELREKLEEVDLT